MPKKKIPDCTCEVDGEKVEHDVFNDKCDAYGFIPPEHLVKKTK